MSAAASTPGMTRANRLSIMERMLVMRRFEERLFELHAAGHLRGVFHLYIGQEGTGAAVLEALAADDYILSTHRNHGHVVGRGADVGRAYAELIGRATGLQGGRGGSFHLCDPAKGVLQTSAIVGGCVGLATGAAYGIRQSGGGRVATGFFGDAALEEGVAFESFTLAALWKLPVIYVCENNSIGAGEMKGDSYPRSMLGTERLSRVPETAGVRSLQVSNGANAAEVHAAALEARAHCLAGKGPVFIESPIVRWPGGRSLFPKSTGATELALAWGGRAPEGPNRDWQENHDPVIRWARAVLAAGDASRDELLALDGAVLARNDAGLRYALDSPWPDAATATDKVFA